MHPDFRFPLICYFIFHTVLSCQSQDFIYSGQLSSWLSVNQQKEKFAQLGIRYIPSLSFSTPFSNDYLFDLEASIKAFSNAYFQSSSKPQNDQDLSAYRMWMRLSGSQYELRLGLQKINFGSASVFRPLMWFDTIDPRDPLQITSGVYGILGRYYFLNNANLWLWALIGNNQTKGWELIPTAKGKPEFGGRLQIPFFFGEVALSYHYRQLNLGPFTPNLPIEFDTLTTENRLGFDGKWDIEIGFWIEAVVIHHESDLLLYKWEQSFNIGCDYTFYIGNGFTVLTEYFVLESTKKILHSGEGIRFSTLSLSYPLDVFDTINGMIYYDWDNKGLYRFLSYQRNYDHWSFYLFAFWNPDEYKLDITTRESSQFAGKGIQFMVVLNH